VQHLHHPCVLVPLRLVVATAAAPLLSVQMCQPPQPLQLPAQVSQQQHCGYQLALPGLSHLQCHLTPLPPLLLLRPWFLAAAAAQL
jgi:hypothetical protein